MKLPQRLATVNHYHQAAGVHPNSHTIRPGEQLVELVTGGRGWVWHEQQWVQVVPGVLLWHIPGDGTIGRSDFDDPYRCLAVRFECDDADVRPVGRVSQWTDLDEIHQFTRQVLNAYVDEAFDCQVLSAYAYSRLLFQARRYEQHHPAAQLPVSLERVLEAIRRHYSEPLTLRDLAQTAGWSVAHLHAMFQTHLNISPHQYLIRQRLQAARQQLISSSAPIKQVARECGFASAAALCRSFKQATGSSPTAYRQQHFTLHQG